jgi:hypothetical protein
LPKQITFNVVLVASGGPQAGKATSESPSGELIFCCVCLRCGGTRFLQAGHMHIQKIACRLHAGHMHIQKIVCRSLQLLCLSSRFECWWLQQGVPASKLVQQPVGHWNT